MNNKFETERKIAKKKNPNGLFDMTEHFIRTLD